MRSFRCPLSVLINASCTTSKSVSYLLGTDFKHVDEFFVGWGRLVLNVNSLFDTKQETVLISLVCAPQMVQDHFWKNTFLTHF